MSYQLKLPKKSDYPNNFKVLDKPSRSAEYHQLVEASASAYFETTGPARWLFMKRFKIAFKYLKQIGKVGKILDAGTGIGFFLPTLVQFSDKVVGFDYAEHTLSYAKKMCQKLRVSKVSFEKKDLFTHQFKAKQYEVINALSVLEHVPPKKLNKLIKQFKKTLKPGGFLIAGYPNEGFWLFKVVQVLEKVIMRPKMLKSIKDHDRDYQPLGHVATLKEIDQAIRREFKVINYQGLPFNFLKFYGIGLYQV